MHIKQYGFYLLLILLFGCGGHEFYEQPDLPIPSDTILEFKTPQDTSLFQLTLNQDVRIKDYFAFIDSLVTAYDSLLPYPASEHLFVHANSWIIDSLMNTDYYIQKSRGEFVYDQQEMLILRKGQMLLFPNEKRAAAISAKLDSSWININIPEFALRLMEGEEEKYNFKIRVGRNEKRFLATANRVENLRTKTGRGHIWKITKDPRYINPVDATFYATTSRDDKKRTKLPQIPFLSPELDGHSWGQLIHPTTNPETLGRAYSNGCIGTAEAAAWRIYYHSPVGTPIVIRYELEGQDENDQPIQFKDIYKAEPVDGDAQ